MGGLIFYHAVAANVIVMLAYLGVGTALQLPGREFAYNALAMVAANMFGASVVYMHEKTSRMRFLEACLLREMVARDGLTGIQNRRMFDQHIQRVWQQAVREEAARGGAARRHRLLQGLQRPLRASGGRRMPARRGRFLEPVRAPAIGFRRALRRRRVRDRALRGQPRIRRRGADAHSALDRRAEHSA